MALSIKDQETDDLARELAEKTGQTLTEAVKQALRERLMREQRLSALESGLANRLVDIGRRCAAQMKEPIDSSDHADFLYDEKGLPR